MKSHAPSLRAICAIIICHALGIAPLRAQISMAVSGPSQFTPCPGANADQVTITFNNTSGAPIAAGTVLALDLGVDLALDESVEFGPFLQPVEGTVHTTSISSVSWTTYGGVPAILIEATIPTGSSSITFTAEPKCSFSYVRANTADQGPINSYVDRARLYADAQAAVPMVSAASAAFSIIGPQLLVASMPAPVLVPLGAATVTRNVSLTGVGGPAPANGIIVFEDQHVFSDLQNNDDPVTATEIRYNDGGTWVHIARDASSSADGRDRFLINGNSSDSHERAFYQAILAGETPMEEVFDVSGLCSATVPPNEIQSELRVGWGCGSSTTLCDYSIRQGVVLQRDPNVANITMEEVEMTFPPGYYVGDQDAVITVRISNTGGTSANIRSVWFESAFYAGLADPGTTIRSRIVLGPDDPIEISVPVSIGQPASWPLVARTLTATAPDAVVLPDASTCSSTEERLSIFNDGDQYMPALEAHQMVEVRFRVRVCDPSVGYGGLECGGQRDNVMTAMRAWTSYDYTCHELTYAQVHNIATASSLGGHFATTYLRAPRLQASRTQYIGDTYNLIGACFYGSATEQMNWQIKFKLRDAVSLWPRPDATAPGQEKVALVLELEPYLYLRPEDLLGAYPLTITTANGDVYSTSPSVAPAFHLSILDPSSGPDDNNTVNFCHDLDCPTGSHTNDGWSQLQKVVLVVDGFDPSSPNWLDESDRRFRRMTKFQGAVVDIPLRMHCPKEAQQSDCDTYVAGCEFSPDLDHAPTASPRKMRISLVQIPDGAYGNGGTCGAPMLPLSCLVQTFNIQCPGCTRIGIHSEKYTIARWNYGYVDGRSGVQGVSGADDGFADLGVDADHDGVFDPGLDPITYDEVMSGQHPDVDRYKAMYGDMVLGKLSTRIEMDAVNYGPSVNGLPAVDLPYLYMTTVLTPEETLPCSAPMKLVDVKMEFRLADGTPFNTVTIDCTADGNWNHIPDAFEGGPGVQVAMAGTGEFLFDLSAPTLTGRSFVTMTDPTHYGPGFTFTTPAYENMLIDISTRYQVVCNVGLNEEVMTVNNQVFLATHPQTQGLGSINSEFVDSDANFLTMDCATADCSQFQYYCTKKGGGFRLSGYQFDVATVLSREEISTCSYGPQYIYRFTMEPDPPAYNAPTPFSSFPFEFRNWADLVSTTGWFNALSPNDWSNGQVELTEFTVGGIRPGHTQGDRTLTYSPGPGVTYDPVLVDQNGERHQVLGLSAPAIDYTDGTRPAGTEVEQPTDRLLLPDDGFSIGVGFVYDANCTTPTGPSTEFAPNYYQYTHHEDVGFHWSAPLALATDQALDDQMLPFLNYERPVLSLLQEKTVQYPATCWSDITIGHTTDVAPPTAHTPISGLWVAFDEDPGGALFADGMDVTSVEYRLDGGAYHSLVADAASGVKYTIPALVFGYTNVQVRVCANVPCLVPTAQDHDQGSPGDAPNGDAEAMMYVGWACAPTAGDLGNACNAQEIIRYVPATPLMQVPSVQVEPVSCERYRVTMELLSTGTSPVNGIDIGADVAMVAGSGWSYVPGSAKLLDADQVVLGTAGAELNEPVASANECGGGNMRMRWDLGPGACSGCTGALAAFLQDGLCAGTPPLDCSQAFVQFDIERPQTECGAMLVPVQVWARSATCGIQCQLASASISAAVAPAGNVIAALNAPAVTDCAQGTTITVVVENPNAQTLDHVSVTLDLPAGLVAATPANGCATSVQLAGGDVTWTFDALPPAVPCTLSVAVHPATCVNAQYDIHATANVQCCNLGVGSASGTVAVSIEAPPCTLAASATVTPAACGGPWQVLRGAYPAGNGDQFFLGDQLFVNGTAYRFVDGGGALIAYDANVWTLTGELVSTTDPDDGFWLQLYLDQPVSSTSWALTHTLDGNPGSNVWDIYSVSANPAWPSLIAGLGTNTNEVYDLTAEPGYGFQIGDGANAQDGSYGASLRFRAALRGTNTVVPGKFVSSLSGDMSQLDFSPCNGSITVNITGGQGGSYAIVVTPPHGDPLTANTPLTSYTFGGLCNTGAGESYTVQVTNAACTASVTGLELVSTHDPLRGEVESMVRSCEPGSGCALATNVSGGQPPYQISWFWQGIIDDPQDPHYGQPPTTAPGEIICGLPTNEENWVVISDANGCYITYKYFILEGEDPGTGYTVSTTPSCVDNGTATVTLTPQVANGHYAIQWSGPNGFTSSAAALTDLVPGSYSVTVTSIEAGCAWTTEVQVADACPCTTPVEMLLETDNAASETSWEIIQQGTTHVVCSGSGYPDLSTIVDDGCCLADGCYVLHVYDSQGNGMYSGATGGYTLRRASDGERFIDDKRNFSAGSLSAISGGQGFCVPMSAQALTYGSRDRVDWAATQFLIATLDPEVTAVWNDFPAGSTQRANTGYEFWFFDPNGTFSSTRFRSHATTDGGGSGSYRASYVKVGNVQNISQAMYKLLNVRVRARVYSDVTPRPWGPAYRFKYDPDQALCPLSRLIDDPADQYFSCGAYKHFGNGNYVVAYPVSGANRYQFRFRIPEENFEVVRTSTTYTLQMNWTPLSLQAGKTYQVDVRVSKDGGNTWCTSGNEWGELCPLHIIANGNLAPVMQEMAAHSELTLWPNPNGTREVSVLLQELPADASDVHWELFDALGRRVMDEHWTPQEKGTMRKQVHLPADTGVGVYLVQVHVGDQRFTERLVIEH